MKMLNCITNAPLGSNYSPTLREKLAHPICLPFINVDCFASPARTSIIRHRPLPCPTVEAGHAGAIVGPRFEPNSS